MKYIIVDLEATCINPRSDDFISEIIEIGAVKIENDKITDTFNIFVKPTINPILSDFCKELTSITQKDVDNGMSRKEALLSFIDFCKDSNYILSWGGYDKNQLRKECERISLKTDWLSNHRNLKLYFSDLLGKSKQFGMERALSIAGLPLDGTHHRGIDDAKNIAKIFLKYEKDWDFTKKLENKKPYTK